MHFIDSHTHLYVKEFENDLQNVLMNAQDAGVKRFYLPAIDSSVIEDMLQLEKDYPGVCIAMMGLHPCSVTENYIEELRIVEQWCRQRPFAAIGEIGLDFYWDKTFVTQQYDAFERQMELALQLQLPIVIHTRNAMAETIATVKPFAERGLRGIFHCFGDNIIMANQVIAMGFYLGIGGVLTYKNSGLDEVLKHVSLDHIVLETDAPYLSPVPYRGKRNEPAYIRIIAEKLAEVKGVTIEEVAEKTTANSLKIFEAKH